MDKKIKILFVCMGNICRSPAGENILRHFAEQEGLGAQIFIDSCGTIDFHTGHAPDARMQKAATKRGLPMEGGARQIQPEDLEKFDLILAMDRDNLAGIQYLDRKDKYTSKIRLFCDFCTQHQQSEVPDPYHGGAAGFDLVLDLLEDGCQEIIRQIQSDSLFKG